MTKKQRRNWGIAIATIVMILLGFWLKNDRMDDSHDYSDAELVGTACTHPGCNCEQYYGHYNNSGQLFGKCMHCKHSFEEHGLSNSQQRFAGEENTVWDYEGSDAIEDEDE